MDGSVAVIGAGPLARRVSRVVTEVGAAFVAEHENGPEPNVLVIAGPVPHLAPLLRRALGERTSVLVIDPIGLDEPSLRRLTMLARHREAHFHIIRTVLARPSLDAAEEHVRRERQRDAALLLSVAIALTSEADEVGLVAAAEDALLVLSRLAGTLPRSIAALHAEPGPELRASPLAALVPYRDGAIGQVRVAGGSRHAFAVEVVGTDSVLRLDLADPRAPLHLEVSALDGVRRHNGSDRPDDGIDDMALRDAIARCWRVPIDGPIVDVGVEPEAIRLRSALLASIAKEGEPQPVTDPAPAHQPDLRLIIGGGKSENSDRTKPRLRLVGAGL